MSRFSLVLAIILATMSQFGLAMRFDLQSGTSKCISEDIRNRALTVGKYAVVNPNDGYPIPDSHKVTVRVASPSGHNYHYGDLVDSGNFAFTATEAGDYATCFWGANQKPAVTMTVDFDWKTGVAAKDWSKIARKGQVENMDIELKKLYETVNAIHEEMFILREREEEMQQLNRETYSRMISLGFFSLLVCLSVAGLQLWHLKSFFERKKLL